MNQPLKRYTSIALIVLVCYAVFVMLVFNLPTQTVSDENLERAQSEVERFAELLQDQPIHSWSDQMLLDDGGSGLWMEVDSIETFEPADAEKLLSGEALVDTHINTGTTASRLVPGTDHAITVYPEETFFDLWSYLAPVTIAMLLLLFALYYLIVDLPLSRQLSTIELATQSYARGNFSIRVPVDDSSKHQDVTRGFNEMAGQIEELITENNSMLEDYREMLRAVAHEFRGPLARMRFALDMATDDASEKNSNLLHKMSNDIDGLNLLVGEVLSYARLQPGAPGFTFSKIELNEIVDNALAECRLNYPSINFAITSATNKSLLTEVDSFYMQRAILNLLNNAARHADKSVSIEWGADQQNYSIRVDDDGDGVPMHWKERIFEPFVRVDPSRSRQSGGVGLGLSIARRIAENHHGTITVDNAPALGGARFCLIWPVGISNTPDGTALMS